MVQLELKRHRMELRMQGCCGEQQGEDRKTQPRMQAGSPIPAQAATGNAGRGFIRCLALVCIHGKKKTRALLSPVLS